MENACLLWELLAPALGPTQLKDIALTKQGTITKLVLTVSAPALLEAAVPALDLTLLKDSVMIKPAFTVKSATRENVFHLSLEILVIAFHQAVLKAIVIKRQEDGEMFATRENVLHHASRAHHHHHVTIVNHGFHHAQYAASYQSSSTQLKDVPSVLQRLHVLPSRQLLLMYQLPIRQLLHLPASHAKLQQLQSSHQAYHMLPPLCQ